MGGWRSGGGGKIKEEKGATLILLSIRSIYTQAWISRIALPLEQSLDQDCTCSLSRTSFFESPWARCAMLTAYEIQSISRPLSCPSCSLSVCSSLPRAEDALIAFEKSRDKPSRCARRHQASPAPEERSPLLARARLGSGVRATVDLLPPGAAGDPVARSPVPIKRLLGLGVKRLSLRLSLLPETLKQLSPREYILIDTNA